jgi:hypothetical protein
MMSIAMLPDAIARSHLRCFELGRSDDSGRYAAIARRR